MKKILSILLALVLTVGIGAVAASAAEGDAFDDALNVAASISVGKGFAKNGAKYFMELKAQDPDMTFSVEDNSQFTINPNTGKMTFKTGLPNLLPIPVTVVSGGDVMTVNVTTYYEWYEYLVIVFAAGIFWIAAVNN